MRADSKAPSTIATCRKAANRFAQELAGARAAVDHRQPDPRWQCTAERPYRALGGGPYAEILRHPKAVVAMPASWLVFSSHATPRGLGGHA
jgi:hypothetical protein